MVATVLRLRYRILGNALTRSPWQLVGFIVGMLSAAWVLGLAVVGLVALSILQGLDPARIVSTLGGSVLVLGWVVGPILTAGMDTSVDAARLAPFPLTTAQVMRALTAAGLGGIPGIATAVGGLATLVLWVRWPVALPFALVGVVLAVLTCVVASRLMAALATGLGGNRRGREAIGTLVLIVLVLSGPILVGILSLLDAGAGVAARVRQIAEVLGWTPLGAAWAVPGDVAAGAWLPAIAKLAIAAATLAVLWLLWRWTLIAATASPGRRSSGRTRAGALGWFGRMPTGGVGATWARGLTAWLRDPRYLRQLVVVPLLPIVFLFVGGVEGPFAASALIVGFILGSSMYTDVSYDGTAFAGVLATGIRGSADRLGRLLGAATLGVPLTVLTAIVTVGVSGRWWLLPAMLGGGLGALLAGYGVSAVSSALIVMPVARPGDSPFKSVPGQTFVMGILVFVVWGAGALLALPSLIPALISFAAGSELAGWIALAAGIVVGAAVLVVGVVVGGRTFDRRAPELLAQLRAFPG